MPTESIHSIYKYPVDEKTLSDVKRRFTYHKPVADQNNRYDAITEHTRNLALLYVRLCPPSRELSTALTLLAQARMMANAGIAINEQEHDA